MLNTEEFVQKLKNLIGKELETHKEYPKVHYMKVSRARVEPIARLMRKAGAMLQGIFGADQRESFELNYFFSLDNFRTDFTFLFRTEVDKRAQISSITRIFACATQFETELTNRLGVEFAKASQVAEEEEHYLCAPYNLMVGANDYNLFQFGVFNQIHKNNSYFEFNIAENRIKDLEIKTGWQYRGIQPLLESVDVFQPNIPVLNRISGLSCFHHQLAFYLGLEELLEISIPNKANYIRCFLAELERIQNHLIWFNNLLVLLGYDKKYSFLTVKWAEFMELFELINQKPNLSGLVSLGSAKEIDNISARKIQGLLQATIPPVINSLYEVIYTDFTREKTENVAIVSMEDALTAGYTGPNLRASGVPYDIRHSSPYLNYVRGAVSQLWDVVSFTRGDVFARIQTRYWELKHSYEICQYLIEELTTSFRKLEPLSLRDQDQKLPANELVISRVEAPHGVLLWYLKTNPEEEVNTLDTVRIMTPELFNVAGLQRAGLRGARLSNVPLIIHSTDLSFLELDL